MKLSALLTYQTVDTHTCIESASDRDGLFGYAEADIIIISYVIKTEGEGKQIGFDTTFYLFGKRKLRAVKALLHGDFPVLDSVFGEVGATHADLMSTAKMVMCSLYRFRIGKSMGQGRHCLYTRKKSKLQLNPI